MDIAGIAAQATTEVVDMFPGLINTYELKARVKDTIPLQDGDYKSNSKQTLIVILTTKLELQCLSKIIMLKTVKLYA